MKWLNYHHLIYFKEIATLGSISKASEKLLIGQPALSAQLKQFENYLGQQLFERKNRKLILTEAGKIALDYANEIGQLGQEFLQVFQEKSFSKKTHLQIGALESIPKFVLLDIIKKAREIGNCFVSVLEGTGPELFQQLKTHNLDMIISDYHGDFAGNKNIFSKSFLKVPVSIFGAKKFANLKRTFPESLNKMPFILPTSHSKLRHDLDHYFLIHEMQYDTIAETQDTSLLKLMCTQGLGLMPLADMAVKELIREKKLYRIGTIPDMLEEYWAVTTKRMIDNPIAAELMKIL